MSSFLVAGDQSRQFVYNTLNEIKATQPSQWGGNSFDAWISSRGLDTWKDVLYEGKRDLFARTLILGSNVLPTVLTSTAAEGKVWTASTLAEAGNLISWDPSPAMRDAIIAALRDRTSDGNRYNAGALPIQLGLLGALAKSPVLPPNWLPPLIDAINGQIEVTGQRKLAQDERQALDKTLKEVQAYLMTMAGTMAQTSAQQATTAAMQQAMTNVQMVNAGQMPTVVPGAGAGAGATWQRAKPIVVLGLAGMLAVGLMLIARRM